MLKGLKVDLSAFGGKVVRLPWLALREPFVCSIVLLDKKHDIYSKKHK